jgi:hypothetical protein
MSAITMTFYCHKEKNGTITVQNAVMGHLGQRHNHTEAEFKEWRNDIPDKQIVWLDKERNQ